MRHRQTIAVLALVGFFIACYLWLHALGVVGTLQCGNGGCEVVQASRFAWIGRVPVAFVGVGGYATLFALAVAGLQPALLGRAWPTRALAVLSGAGVAFTVYLTWVEAFVLHAFCRWCLGSAVTIALIFIVAAAAARKR